MLKNKLWSILLDPTTETSGNITQNVIANADEELDAALGNDNGIPDVSGNDDALSIKKEVKTTIPDTLKGNEAIGDFDDEDDKGITKAPVKLEPTVIVPKELTADEKKVIENDAKKGARDYSIFNEDDAKILRQAGANPVFNHFKEKLPKLYAAAKESEALKVKVAELEKGIVRMPESYGEHPEAYKLSKEYSDNIANLRQVDGEAAHWMQQLVNIENGESIKIADDKGNLTEIPANKITAELKVGIQQALAKANNYKQHFLSKINTLKDTHVNQYQEAVKSVTEECAKYFPWVKNEKMFNETTLEVEVNGKLINSTIKDLFQDAINMNSPAFRSHPLAQANANLIISNIAASQKIRLLEKELGVKKQFKKDDDRSEVPTSTKSSGVAKASNKGKGNLFGREAIGNFDDM